MRISDLKQVIELQRIIENIDGALRQVEDYNSNVDDVDDRSFYGHLSRFDDGSGPIISIEGCYVCDEVVDSIENVLHAKRLRVISELERLGVDTSGV